MRIAAIATTHPIYNNGTELKGIVVEPHVEAKAGLKRRVVIWPDASGRVDYRNHNNDAPTLKRALHERVFNVVGPDGKLVPTPLPSPGVWRRLGEVQERIARRVINVGWCEPLTCQQFVDQCPANKKALYTRAAEEYTRHGWSPRHARIKPFVKNEKINLTKKADPAPRVIQPRVKEYNIALGRYTRRVESELYQALAEEWGGVDGPPVVMKGLTVEQTAEHIRRKWLKVQNPVAIGLDASRFDQHVSHDALVWEHGIYKLIFGFNPELCALLREQLSNCGTAYLDGEKISYKAKGTRASGDMNTSLGNCLIMCTLVREYIRSLGITAEFANNGDDCVLIVNKNDVGKLDDLHAWFLEFGFEMKVESVATEFENIEFCQTQPVLVCAKTDSWVMVRQPSTALGKDSLSLAESTERGYRQWSYQVGVGGHALYGDMPIYGELYAAYRRNGTPSNVAGSLVISDSGFMRMSKVPRVREGATTTPSDETRLSFFKAFGYPPSVQISMEKDITQLDYCGLTDTDVNTSLGLGLITL